MVNSRSAQLINLMTFAAPMSGRTCHVFDEDFAYFLESVKGDVCITGRKCYAELGSAIPGSGKMLLNAAEQTCDQLGPIAGLRSLFDLML